MILFYDAGYSYVKALSQVNKRLCFPSVVGEVSAYELDLFSNGTQQIEVANHSYLVGDSALRQSMLTIDMQNSDWILSPQWRALLLYAISETTKASKIEVEIVTGLPFSDYLNKELRQQFRESLLGFHIIQRPDQPRQRITITEMRILTQNFGPIFRYLSLDQDAMVGVLNIGSHTVEMATVQLSKGGRPEAIRTQCTSDNRGTRTTLPLLHNLLNKSKPGVRYSDYEIDRGLQVGQIAGVKLDLGNFAQSIQALVDKNWSSYQVVPLNKLTHFIVSGGGASLVGKKLRIDDPEVIVGDQWDVVLGYLAARKVMK
jgi:hypothetical protein